MKHSYSHVSENSKHLMYFCSLITLFFSIISVNATTYYLSSSGSDLNNGLSSSTPWKTINKLNSITLNSGDYVLFKRGDTFKGTINGKKNVTFGAHGSGAKPIISGSQQITSTGWTQYTASGSGHIYYKAIGNTMDVMSSAYAPNLYYNGKLMVPARFPNSGYITADAITEIYPGSYCCQYTLAFKHAWLLTQFSSSDVINSHVTAYTHWDINTEKITSYNPSTGYFTIDSMRGNFDGYHRYYLSRKLVYLDTINEWYYDGNTIYMWFPSTSGPVSTDVIEAFSKTTFSMGNPVNVFGIAAYSSNGIKINDLEFRYWQNCGVWLPHDTNAYVYNCTFNNCNMGIWAPGSNDYPNVNLQIRNCNFENILRVGVDVGYGNNSTIANNTFKNVCETDIKNGIGQSGLNDKWGGKGIFGVAINHYGSNTIIELNRVYNTGRSAIDAGGSNTYIRKNVINVSCINHNDAAGIRAKAYSIVESNIITNTIGYSYDHRWNGARGIYPDFADYVTIKNNTVANCFWGIGLTNSKNNTISNNTIYAHSYFGFSMNRKTAGQLNNTVKKNIFFGLDHTSITLDWENQVSGADNACVLDSNKYWTPYSYYPLVQYRDDSNNPYTLYDLKQWQDKPSWTKDDHSTKEFIFMNEPYKVNNTIGSDKIVNGSFNSNSTGWTPGGMVTHSYPGGIYGMTGKCAMIEYNSGWEGYYSQSNIPLTTNKYYKINFTLKSSAVMRGKKFRIQLVQGSEAIYDRQFKADTVATSYWCIVKANATLNATLHFIFPGTTATGEYFYIDNVTMFEANAIELDPSFKFPIYINDTSITRNFTLSPYTYLDLDSNTVTSNQLTLGAFTSKILIRTGIKTNISGPTALCPSDSTLLDAGSGFKTYQWYKNGVLIPGAINYQYTVNYSNAGNYYCLVTEHNGYDWQSQTVTITAKSASACQTGINEETNPLDVNIYPNPSAGNLFVEINSTIHQKLKLRISNLLGQCVYEENVEVVNISSTIFVSLPELAGGIYHINLVGNDKTVSKQLFISK